MILPPSRQHPCPPDNPTCHDFPWHFLPGGQAKFTACLLLIVLIWWGWRSLTRKEENE